MEIKYPSQIIACKREKKVLGVDFKLCLPTDDESPLIMHAGWSRFVMTIINKEVTPTVTPYANVRAEDISFISRKTDAIMDAVFKKELAGKPKSSSSELNLPYKNIMLKFGNCRNMTILEVALSPDGLKELTFAKNIYEQNVDKYPRNQATIDAIDACIADLNAGKLKNIKNASTSVSVIYVYKEDYKPLANKKNDAGEIFNYAIEIGRDMTKDKSPWFITIKNGYAPEGKGLSNNNLTKATFNLTDEEWCRVIYTMKSAVEHFEICHFREQEKRAQGALEANIRNSKS